MKSPRAAKLYEERLRPEAVAALRGLLGCRYLEFLAPALKVTAADCFSTELSIQVVRNKRFSLDFVGIELKRFDTPILDLNYYQFNINIEDRPRVEGFERNDVGGSRFTKFPSQWTYDVNSQIDRIDVFELHSLPQQVAMWPNASKIEEATIFDALIAFRMSDGGSVTLRGAFGGSLLCINRLAPGPMFGPSAGYQLRTTLTSEIK